MFVHLMNERPDPLLRKSAARVAEHLFVVGKKG
jgi:hypothetical protein